MASHDRRDGHARPAASSVSGYWCSNSGRASMNAHTAPDGASGRPVPGLERRALRLAALPRRAHRPAPRALRSPPQTRPFGTNRPLKSVTNRPAQPHSPATSPRERVRVLK